MTIDELENQIRICKQILNNTDYQALKHADGVLSDEEYEETNSLRKEMRTKINEYEAQIIENEKE